PLETGIYADRDQCIEKHREGLMTCAQDLNDKVEKHAEDLKKHQSDPENVSEETKKDCCCAEWKFEDCAINKALKDDPKCIELFKKEMQTKSDQFHKLCGEKYFRGGVGC